MIGVPYPSPSSDVHQNRASDLLEGDRAEERAVGVSPGTADHGTVIEDASPSPVPLSLVVERDESEMDMAQENEGMSMGARSTPVMVSMR